MRIEPLHINEWISVKDRLPPEAPDYCTDPYASYVLIWYFGTLPDFTEEWHVRIGEHVCGHWRPVGSNGNFDDRVSHWMPLPSGPFSALAPWGK